MITKDQFELIEEALSVYTNTLNDRKGITIINRQAGRILAELESSMNDHLDYQEVDNGDS